ncbi:MAG: diacylglycerol kinase [Nocardioides sp.]|nr:diacylglycerol kinase [Nocardioides sp.]
MLVAAVARNGVIGDGPRIPWRLPGEQQQFKELTTGHVLLMGRTTYESIGRPLPGRTTVVLTRDPDWTAGEHADVVHVVHHVEEALALAGRLHAEGAGDLVVAGGAQVYRGLAPYADRQVVTEVPLEPAGDVHYPPIDPDEWVETSREHFEHWDRVSYDRR